MRALIFTDANGPVTSRLIRAAVRIARERGDEIAGIVTTHPERFRFTALARCKRIARGARFIDLYRLERRTGIPVLVPPEADLHEPAFVRRLGAARADVALSLYCLRIFRRPLLELFEQAVNFHNGLLPRYRGLRATSFAIYAGEPHAGFTYHRMSEGVDEGAILVQEPVPIYDRDALADVTERTARSAVAALPRVIECIAARDPGRPQSGPGSYFSRRDVEAIVHVDAPERLAAGELERRLRAFGTLSIAIEGERHPVTRLRAASPGAPLAFRTADAQWIAPDRFRGLPRFLYRR